MLCNEFNKLEFTQLNVELKNSINHPFEGLSERTETIPQQLPCKIVSCVLKYPATWGKPNTYRTQNFINDIIHIYIYIYRERERERESKLCMHWIAIHTLK